MEPEPPRNPRKILVSRPGRLGDLLLAVPALRALKSSFPAAEIALITQPRLRRLASRYAYVDRFLAFPGFPGMPSLIGRRQTVAFLRRCQDEGYDLVLQCQGREPAAAIFASLLGGRFIAGYCRSPEVAAYLDRCLDWQDDEPDIRRLLRLVAAVGATARDERLEFPLWREDVAELDRHDELRAALAADRRLVGLHPGAGAPAKHWSPRSFAALADALAIAHGCTIILLGGSADHAAVCDVKAAARTPRIVVAKPLSLGGLAALLARLDLYIGNDSGPSHLAVAMDTPSIAIFGPANPARWAPLDPVRHKAISAGVECSPCDYAVCPLDHRCMTRVTVEAVVGLAGELLAAPARSSRVAPVSHQSDRQLLPVVAAPTGSARGGDPSVPVGQFQFAHR